MSEKRIRTRFAPSPTGPLHIGGVRTALYNYLFAKKHGGDFLLRIEDTDQTRFVAGAEDYIIEALNWCGITVDEGASVGGPHAPYKQSERKEFYKKYADELLANGNAYYAFDTADELNAKRAEAEAEKKTFAYDQHIRMQLKNSLSLTEAETKALIESGAPYVIRFKMPEGELVKFNDLIRGDIEVNTATLDDKVLFKSDGLPTYHLANVVDDKLMEISHVIRGEEWLPSTPMHVLLYKSLGWDMPTFAHMPLTLKPSGKGKLSKRDGDQLGFPVFPLEWTNPANGEKSMGYREEGYFPDAFINILAFLGWNPGTEQEIFSMQELIDAFSMERINKAGSRFDPEKAKWYNHQYLMAKANEELADDYMKILANKNISASKEVVTKIVSLVKERANFVSDFWEQSNFFFEAPTEYDDKTVKKKWKGDVPVMMRALCEVILQIDDFSSASIEEKVKAWITEKELGMGQVMNGFRLALVGAPKGPHLFDIAEIIGKDETLSRLDTAIEKLPV